MSGTGKPGWAKSPPELVARFDEVLARQPGAQIRQMFGYPAAFVGGNMATGLHQETWMVRLPEDARGELLGLAGARVFEPMAGRPMREYVVLPPSVIGDDAALDGWIARSIAFAASLPAK